VPRGTRLKEAPRGAGIKGVPRGAGIKGAPSGAGIKEVDEDKACGQSYYFHCQHCNCDRSVRSKRFTQELWICSFAQSLVFLII